LVFIFPKGGNKISIEKAKSEADLRCWNFYSDFELILFEI
jgi:hypothetical protein